MFMEIKIWRHNKSNYKFKFVYFILIKDVRTVLPTCFLIQLIFKNTYFEFKYFGYLF